MRPTRLALAATLLLIALAIVPWTVRAEHVTTRFAELVAARYGLSLEAPGEAAVTLLPAPRLKLSGVVLRSRNGEALVRDALLRAELRVLPLLLGRLEPTDLFLGGATVRVRVDEDGGSNWAPTAAALRAALAGRDGPALAERITLRNARLELDDRRRGSVAVLPGIGAVLSWPGPDRPMSVAVSTVWNGEAVKATLVGLEPAAHVAGRADAVAFEAESRLGRMRLSGSVTWADLPRFAGDMQVETRSLGGLARWLGTAPHLRDAEIPVSLRGTGTLDGDALTWPRAQVKVGEDGFEGSLELRLDADRPKVRATLAGERLDLSWLSAGLATRGLGSAGPAEPSEPTLADYDLRLSAATVRFDRLRLREAAAGILVNGDRLELSLARATLGNGIVKGRLSAAAGENGQRELRGQVSVERIDVGPLLAAAGQPKVLTGTLSGQASFEAAGDEAAEMARHLRGRAIGTVRDGEIAGISLAEAWRREGRGTGASAPEWRGGRTPFEQAQLVLSVSEGVAEISECTLSGPSTQTVIGGQVSLPDRHMSLRTTTRGAGEAEGSSRAPFVLEIRGPLGELVLAPGEAGAVRPSPAALR